MKSQPFLDASTDPSHFFSVLARRCRWTGGKIRRNPWSVSSFWRTERHQWSIWNSGMCWSHRLLDDSGTLHILAWRFIVIHFGSQDFFEDLSTPEKVEERKRDIKRAKGKKAMVFMASWFYSVLCRLHAHRFQDICHYSADRSMQGSMDIKYFLSTRSRHSSTYLSNHCANGRSSALSIFLVQDQRSMSARLGGKAWLFFNPR